MAIRMTDTDIWEEDWFIDLPNEYKLFYLYLKDKCDHSGMWRPNRRKFTMSVHGKMIHYDEFLDFINKDPETGQKVKRIVVLENGKWFITRFISFQLGGKFKIKIGAHRGALELLINNGIHPREVPKMDWCGLENIEMEELTAIAHDKGLYRLSLQYVGGTLREIEREKEKEREPEREILGGKESSREKPKFKLQALYDKSWKEVDTRERDFKGITETQFTEWKAFVDWVVENEFTELFRAIFVSPADFTTLVTRNGFTKDLWEPVVRKMLGTGIKPEQNLYFRIPDYMKHVNVSKSIKNDSMNAGDGNYEQMEKW